MIKIWSCSFAIALLIHHPTAPLRAAEPEFGPTPDEQQLPLAMHSKMEQLPQISVGRIDADIVGIDNRALQAAVDYIAALGGGTVHIGAGEYLMHDSLHLRSHVTIRGSKGKTLLRKADAAESELGLDGDFGEQQITLRNADGFEVGHGVAIWDDNAGGFHVTVARITGRRGNTVSINKPLMSDYMVGNHARAATVFPIVSGYDLQGAKVQDLEIDGNKSANTHLTGCRGAGIFLYRAFGTEIDGCIVRNYNGDGISFQQSNDVQVRNSIAEHNAALGLHPGSGSQRPVIRNCVARYNGTDGLFLCWRVRHGEFADNLLQNNGRFGISIGHKDSDNLLQRNHVIGNNSSGIFFRNETTGMAAHRNRLRENVIENNGDAGIRVRGETNDLVFEGNIIRDTRPESEQTQQVGVLIEEQAGNVTLSANEINARTQIVDRRPTSGGD